MALIMTLYALHHTVLTTMDQAWSPCYKLQNKSPQVGNFTFLKGSKTVILQDAKQKLFCKDKELPLRLPKFNALFTKTTVTTLKLMSHETIFRPYN